MSNLDKAIKMLKKAKEEAQKELGKQAHKLAGSGKALSDKILAGYYQAINKIDDLIENISSKTKKTETDGRSEPKKRGRKPAVKAVTAEEKPKRGRKPKAKTAEETEETPKKRGRKPGRKAKAAGTTSVASAVQQKKTVKTTKGRKPARKPAGRKRSKSSVDSPIAIVKEYLASVHDKLVNGSLTGAEVIKQLEAKGVNRNTAGTQYYTYRRQNGISSGRS